MLYYSLKSLDKLDALKKQEKLADNISSILATPLLILIDYSSHPLNLLLVSALVAFNPANPYQSSINLFLILDSSRNPRRVLDS